MRPFALLLLAGGMLRGQFTLEEVMGSAFPSELAAAPAGGAVALVLNDRGARNIWVAEGPEYRARKLTRYAEDDGQEIASLRFTPGGRAIVYVRGSDANRAGEIPNPTSSPEGAEQAVWLAALDGAAPRKIADGRSPLATKRGVVYASKGQAWLAEWGEGAKPRQLFKMRGNVGGMVASPDGEKLAFLSARGGHAFLGVYEFEARTLRFPDASLDTDAHPVWSPDSRQVAYARFPASSDRTVFGPKRAGEPWSIRVLDVAAGKARELWRADPGRGSVFRFIVADSQLRWMADGRIVFPWERDGWTHLYSIPSTGGEPLLLTPGRYEVEYVAPTHDGRAILFNANKDDIDRRRLFQVSASGGTVAALTSGKGIEWAPTPTADGKALAWLASDARAPAHAVIRAGGGAARPLVEEAVPRGFPSAALVEPAAVTIDATDGMKIPAQLFLPRGAKPGDKRPAAVFFHGGSRRQMLLGWHYSPYYHHCYALSQYLASKGWVALSVNYRSGTGYGMEFREALDYGATGASEFRDVLGAGLYLRGRPEVDGARIASWGGSYGGYLTAMALARASGLFAAGVDIHGVHDWNVVTRNFVPSYDPRANEAAARLAFESSPMASVKTWRSPVLLIHGDDDRNVPFSESVTLVEALRKQGVEHEQLVFPDEVHSFLRHENWLRALRAAADFLERKLGRR